MPKMFEIDKPYEPRWIKKEHVSEAYNLYHLARTALSGQKCGVYERILWASKELSKKYDYLTPTAAYKDLDCLIRPR